MLRRSLEVGPLVSLYSNDSNRNQWVASVVEFLSVSLSDYRDSKRGFFIKVGLQTCLVQFAFEPCGCIRRLLHLVGSEE